MVHIFKKTRSTLRQPWFRPDAVAVDEGGDLAGPLLFAVLLGVTHLLVRPPARNRLSPLGLISDARRSWAR